MPDKPTAVVPPNKLRPRMVCPIMTPGVMSPAPPPSRLVTAEAPPPAQQQVAFCIEHQCAFWLQMQERPGGPVTGGACCIPVLAQGLNALHGLALPVAQVHAQMLAAAAAEAEARANPSQCDVCKSAVPAASMLIRANGTAICAVCAERINPWAEPPPRQKPPPGADIAKPIHQPLSAVQKKE